MCGLRALKTRVVCVNEKALSFLLLAARGSQRRALTVTVMERPVASDMLLQRKRRRKASSDLASLLAASPTEEMTLGAVLLALWTAHVAYQIGKGLMDMLCKQEYATWKARAERWHTRGRDGATYKSLPKTFDGLGKVLNKPEWLAACYTEIDFCPNVDGNGKEYEGGKCGRPFWDVPRSGDVDEVCAWCKIGRRFQKPKSSAKQKAKLTPTCTTMYLEPEALAHLIFNDRTISVSRWEQQHRIWQELVDGNPDVRSCFSSVAWRRQIGHGDGLERVGGNFYCVKLSMSDDAKVPTFVCGVPVH